MSKREPVYQQIAKDIAHRIVQGELKEGERMSGRTILSSDYGVSPETIRRSLNILVEYDCVKVIRSSGVVIGPKQNALRFLSQVEVTEDVTELRHRLSSLMEKRKLIDLEIESLIMGIVDQAGRFAHSDPLNRFEFVIKPNSSLAGVSIAASKFYQLTNMTVVGITHKGQMQLSPGPDAVFHAYDVLIVSGHLNDIHKVEKLVQSKEVA